MNSCPPENVKMRYRCTSILNLFLLMIPVYVVYDGIVNTRAEGKVFLTPGRRQSKTLLKSMNAGQKSLETMFSIAICRRSGDKGQSKTLFLTIFDLRSSIGLTFSIAAYPVCF